MVAYQGRPPLQYEIKFQSQKNTNPGEKWIWHTVSNQPWVADDPKTLLKLKDLCPFPFLDGILTVIVSSSIFSTALNWFRCPGKKGLTRQYTLILPNKQNHPP